MKINRVEDIKAHLDRALEMQNVLICILKEGLAESKNVYDKNPILYTNIEFEPFACYEGYYSGFMFYPHGKCQGFMDFNVASFESVVCLEEA